MPVTSKDIAAAMTYSTPIEESFTVQGVKVKVWYDQCAECPCHDSDCFAPALWISAHRHSDFDSYGDGLESVLNRFTDWQISRHWRKICDILSIPEKGMETDCRYTLREYGGRLSSIRRDYFADTLANMRATSWRYALDYLEALRALYILAGVNADTFQRNGYSQGDSVYGLIVHLPEWKERVGFGGDWAANMKAEADSYGAWAWGEVYGFTCGDESCGGFYANNAEYFRESIADAVNSELESIATAQAEAMQAARPDLCPANHY